MPGGRGHCQGIGASPRGLWEIGLRMRSEADVIGWRQRGPRIAVFWGRVADARKSAEASGAEPGFFGGGDASANGASCQRWDDQGPGGSSVSDPGSPLANWMGQCVPLAWVFPAYLPAGAGNCGTSSSVPSLPGVTGGGWPGRCGACV